VHSSAFALRDLAPPPPASLEVEAGRGGGEAGPDESVVAWALRRRAGRDRALTTAAALTPFCACRADETLEELERSKPPLARAAWAVSAKAEEVAQHPGVRAAAKFTADVTVDVARAAVPVRPPAATAFARECSPLLRWASA